MPLTPEQERIRRLWAGDTLANKQLPVGNGTTTSYSPTDYNRPASSNPAADVTPAMSLITDSMKPRTAYQDAIRNRFAGIGAIGSDATRRTFEAQQAAQQYNSGGSDYSYEGQLTGNAERDRLMKLVAAQRGMPYSWGGGNSKGPSYGLSGAGERHGSSKIYGFDCSGLVQYAYAQIGIKMPRLAGQQMAMGQRISMNQARAGDLVGKPGHIAIYAGNGMMWEAPTFGKSVRLVPVRSGMFAVRVRGVG